MVCENRRIFLTRACGGALLVSNDQNGVELSFGAQSSTIRPLLPTALVAAREGSRNSFGSAFPMDAVILNNCHSRTKTSLTIMEQDDSRWVAYAQGAQPRTSASMCMRSPQHRKGCTSCTIETF